MQARPKTELTTMKSKRDTDDSLMGYTTVKSYSSRYVKGFPAAVTHTISANDWALSLVVTANSEFTLRLQGNTAKSQHTRHPKVGRIERRASERRQQAGQQRSANASRAGETARHAGRKHARKPRNKEGAATETGQT